jgi:hypothetical protein
MSAEPKTLVAFVGPDLIGRGTPNEIVLLCKEVFGRRDSRRIALFDDDTGRPMDVDLVGTEAEVLAKLEQHPLLGPLGPKPNKPRGRGRPKLGVVSREVSLLPRHWEWLGTQKGGASATMRRLVEAARKSGSGEEQARAAIDAAHRFMWDIAGDQPDFEEASRALFRQDFAVLAERTAAWPSGIREQLARFVDRASGPVRGR